MSVDRWQTVLVLGGIRSGKSAFAESLVADAPSVRYVATAAGAGDDPEWMDRIEAHQRRRPQSWSTEETGAGPARLALLLAEAKPDDTLLVDDLGGWVAALLDPANQPNDDPATVDTLAAAVRACPARLVVVSPEVGLSLVPTTPVGRAFADAVGTANQALAAACDAVALVVAGQVTWLKPLSGTRTAPGPHITAPPASPSAPVAASPSAAGFPGGRETAAAAGVASPPPDGPAQPVEVSATVVTPLPAADDTAEPSHAAHGDADALTTPAAAAQVVIEPGMDLPLPDPDAGPDARDRLLTLDVPGGGLGSLGEAVEFAAATQFTATPRPWRSPRLLLLAGHHAGGAAAGTDPAEPERRLAQTEAGDGGLARLAAGAGADIAVVRVPAAGAMEDGPVLDEAGVDAALRQGWDLAGRAAEDGRDVLVIGSCGTGTEAVAAAVSAAVTGTEPVAVLPRVLVPGGRIDDDAWMTRCAAVRDALHRIRHESRGAKDILAELGGPDLAVATGALLGAAARRLPVLLDGPVGIAAGLIARDLAGQTRHWCLLPDAGVHALVQQGADVLGLTPVLELGLDLGEGANALAALPLLRSAISLAATLPLHPALAPAGDPGPPPADESAELAEGDSGELPADGGRAGADGGAFIEPEPRGPGPATTA